MSLLKAQRRLVTLLPVIVIIFLLNLIGCISVKPEFINQQEFLSQTEKVNNLSIYDKKPSIEVLPVFTASRHINSNIEMKKLALTSFDGDSVYYQIELQEMFYEGKKGFIVLMYHHNDVFVDVYHTPFLPLNVSGYKKLLNNVSLQSSYFKCEFDTNAHGFFANLDITDKYGRAVVIRIAEDNPVDNLISLIAPVGSVTKKPEYFPYIFIDKFGFVRKGCGVYSVTVGGKEMDPNGIPFTSYLMTRYSLRASCIEWLPNTDTTLSVDKADLIVKSQYSTKDNNGYKEITSQSFDYFGRNFMTIFSPSIPDLIALKNGVTIKGRFSTEVEDITGIMAGEYTITKNNDKINIALHPTEGWQPYPGKLWVTTYLWNSEITPVSENQFKINSFWNRD